MSQPGKINELPYRSVKDACLYDFIYQAFDYDAGVTDQMSTRVSFPCILIGKYA